MNSPCAATLALEDAPNRKWDVCVIGAGPAGALAALEIARQKLTVILIDKSAFPREKVCGCCLNATSLAQLSASGIESLLAESRAVPLREILFSDAQSTAILALPNSRALSRTVLDAALVTRAISAGVGFLPETEARIGNSDGRVRLIELKSGSRRARIEASVVLAADGLAGNSLRDVPEFRRQPSRFSRIGVGTIIHAPTPASYESGRLHMACGRSGYVGLVRLEDGRLDVAAALSPAFVRQTGGVSQAVAHVLGEARFERLGDLCEQRWRGTPALTSQLPRVAAERLFVIGDAAGYVEPITGEGIAWALRSGALVAPIAVTAARNWNAGHAHDWSKAYCCIRAEQKSCSLLSSLMRSRLCVRVALATLSRLPALADPLLRKLNRGIAV